MQDIEVINRFKEWISWGDETDLIEYGDTKRTFMDTGRSLYVPTHYEAINIDDLLEVQAFTLKRVVVLVWGDPSEKQAKFACEQCYGAGLSASFVDVVGSLAWSDWLTRSLDGIDWNRSLLKAVETGFACNAVMEWDD